VMIEEHRKQTAAFRPPQGSLKTKLRDFMNALVYPDPNVRPLPFKEPRDHKRITGVLYELERLGRRGKSRPLAHLEIFEQFDTQLGNEYALTAHIKEVQELFDQAGQPLDLEGWLPVYKDIDFILAHWRQIEPFICLKWNHPNRQGIEIAANINLALRQYINAKHELTRPEYRLEKIARSLGVVALPAEARQEAINLNRELKNRAIGEALKNIIDSPTLAENIKQRAGVIRHFMGVAEKQRRPDDDITFGELFISDPNEHNLKFFCVTFRGPDGKVWALLESLTPKTATFAVSMETADQYGPLNLFVVSFGRTAQRELGSKNVYHLRDWTLDSHIERIMKKITG
jgi:hypothetical protein